MNKTTLLLFTLTFSLLSTGLYAEMYKWVDKKGNIVYSDTPPEKDAEALEPPVLNTMPTVKPAPRPKTEEPEQEKQIPYTQLKITSPEHDATLRSNAGTISISVTTTPSLNISKGHYLSITFDGKPLPDKFQSTNTSLNNIDRGTHTISVSIKNQTGGTLISSSPVTVHLHRARQ